jgi:hypothetical protein
VLGRGGHEFHQAVDRRALHKRRPLASLDENRFCQRGDCFERTSLKKEVNLNLKTSFLPVELVVEHANDVFFFVSCVVNIAKHVLNVIVVRFWRFAPFFL